MTKLPSFDERTEVVKHKCHVSGCDGTVTGVKYPILWSREDRAEMHRNDSEWKLRPVPKDVPAEAEYFDVGLGHIADACEEAVKYAGILGKPVAFHFNGRLVVARPGDMYQTLYAVWMQNVPNGDRRE